LAEKDLPIFIEPTFRAKNNPNIIMLRKAIGLSIKIKLLFTPFILNCIRFTLSLHKFSDEHNDA